MAGNGGGFPYDEDEYRMEQLGILVIQAKSTFANISRTPSYVMKTIFLATFLASCFGLDRPARRVFRKLRSLLNAANRKLNGGPIGPGPAHLVQILIILMEQYGIQYFMQWAMDSALCLEEDNCDEGSEPWLVAVQQEKIRICGHEPYDDYVLREDATFCHLAFNCLPFYIFLSVVMLLYYFVTFGDGDGGGGGGAPNAGGGPPPGAVAAPQQPPASGGGGGGDGGGGDGQPPNPPGGPPSQPPNPPDGPSQPPNPPGGPPSQPPTPPPTNTGPTTPPPLTPPSPPGGGGGGGGPSQTPCATCGRVHTNHDQTQAYVPTMATTMPTHGTCHVCGRPKRPDGERGRTS